MFWFRFKSMRLLALLAFMVLVGLVVFTALRSPTAFDFRSYAAADSYGVLAKPTTSQNTKKTIKILYWTKVFRRAPTTSDYCPITGECIHTTDRSEFQHADVVVFHGHDINETDIPLHGPANPLQKFVFFSQEASPSLHMISGGGWWQNKLKFHLVMNYLRNPTTRQVPIPYGGYLVDPETTRLRNFPKIGSFNKQEVLKSKEFKGAIWFVSNCASVERLHVGEALRRHFPVDIAGKCSFEKRDLCPKGSDCRPLISKYYFQLALENSNCKDYVTEKFHDLLSLPVVPIVMKRSVYASIAPSNSFVAVDDFSTAKELAEHLTYLIQNPGEYFKLLEWRNEWGRAGWNSDGYRLGPCALCERLQKERDIPAKPIDDLKQWYAENSPCSRAIQPTWYA